MNNMKRTKNISNVIVQANADYTIRTEMLDGRKHLVVPVVMMTEGVHAGSGGPILHLAEELGRIPDSWNGIPITISHPQTEDGFISANSPQQIQRSVGRVFNTHLEDNKLKAEAWIDEEKISALSEKTLAYIRNGKPLDVSVGIFTDNQMEEGDWNGEQYIAIASNYRPDHLALLPDAQGACSWNDGCGIRVNSKSNKYENMTNFEIFKKLNEEGFAVIPNTNIVDNAKNLNIIQQAVYNLVNAMDNDIRVYYVEEIYDDFYIYRVRNRTTAESKLYKQKYTTSGDGDNVELQLQDDPVEVKRTVSYDTLQKKMQRTKFNNLNSDQMADVSKLVDQLIANTATRFTDCDRQWLSTLSEEALKKLEPEKKEEKPITLDANSALDFLKNNPPKTEDVLQLLSKEERASYEKGLATYNEQRKQLTESIVANSEMKEEDLKDLTFETLQKIAKSVIPVDYSGQSAGGVVNVNSDDDILPIVVGK